MRGLAILILGLWSSGAFGLELAGSVSIKDRKEKPVDLCDSAVVFMEPVSGAAVAPGKKAVASMAAKDKTFVPGILVVEKGTKVTFPNNDLIAHNVFSLSKTKKFDLGLYKRNEGESVLFDKSGIVKVYCNIHKSMTGVILVLDNRLFARVGKDCRYRIPDVPPGKYKVSTWYRYGKGVERTVELQKSETSDFQLRHTKRVRSRHKNKFGKSYRDKY